MTDSHCHVCSGEAGVRELLIGREFFGLHPWETLAGTIDVPRLVADLRAKLAANTTAGVGEIGLDRLKVKTVTPLMREVFISQLRLAGELHLPVVLHGAKCWGDVVHTLERMNDALGPLGWSVPACLFHGFSRSDGLIPEIVSLNGFISVGPAVLNDHAVNYRELVKKIPLDRLLFETDRTESNAATCPSVRDVLRKTAELRGMNEEELERLSDENAARFFSGQNGYCRKAEDGQVGDR